MKSKLLLTSLVLFAAVLAIAGCDRKPTVMLVYDIVGEQKASATPELKKKVADVVTRRLGDAGSARVGSDGRIEVLLSGKLSDEQLKQIDRLITQQGRLEFAVLANNRRHRKTIEQAQKSSDRDVKVDGVVVAGWRQVAKTAKGARKDVAARAGDEVSREVERDREKEVEILVVFDPPDRRVTGAYITSAKPTADPNGQSAVSFSLNSKGAALLASLTANYVPENDGFRHRLAILFNDQIDSAPMLNDVIGGEGQMTGNFTEKEVAAIISLLNSGELPCPIEQVEKRVLEK